ncbi:hypothetical protein MHY_10780 [Megamonas hypermegale ART12/1]|nr:hypothetical protein MHY_10780 [Megamonas hypermegale ART12/1]
MVLELKDVVIDLDKKQLLIRLILQFPKINL